MSTIPFKGISNFLKKENKLDFSHSNFGVARAAENDRKEKAGNRDSFSLTQDISELLSPAYAMTNEEKQEFMKKIMAKLKAGKKLSAEEMQYLKEINPDLYQKVARVQAMREALEQQLAHCRTKQEALEAYSFSMEMVSKDDDMGEYIKAAYQDAYDAFQDSDLYQALPEEDKE